MLLPAEATGTAARKGTFNIPVQGEQNLTVPHAQARAAAAIPARHGAGAVEDVFVFLDDVWILHPNHDGHHRCHGKDLVLTFIPANIRRAVPILTAVVGTNPKRRVRNFVTSVASDDGRIRVAELLEFDTKQLARLHEAEPRIHKTQERQVWITGKQRFRDFRNRGEIGTKTEIAIKPFIEQDLGLYQTRISTHETSISTAIKVF